MSLTLTTAPDPSRLQCRHVFPDGHRCGSPCLRRESFCYYHHTTRRPIEDPAARKARLATYAFPATEITHRSGIQAALGQVLERVASNDLTPRRAGILLYGLQIATLSLPRLAVPIAEAARNMVEEVIEDPQLGTLAPEAELLTPEADDPIRRLVDSLSNDKEPDLATSEPVTSDLYEPEPAESEPTESVLPTIQAVAAHTCCTTAVISTGGRALCGRSGETPVFRSAANPRPPASDPGTESASCPSFSLTTTHYPLLYSPSASARY